MSWIKKSFKPVVTLTSLNQPVQNIIEENEELRKELKKSTAIGELTLFTFRVIGFQIQYQRTVRRVEKDDFIGY